MQSQILKKVNIDIKTKKNTSSLVSDLDVEESMSKVPYQQFLSLPKLHEYFLIKAKYIKIYTETSLFPRSVKGLKVFF